MIWRELRWLWLGVTCRHRDTVEILYLRAPSGRYRLRYCARCGQVIDLTAVEARR